DLGLVLEELGEGLLEVGAAAGDRAGGVDVLAVLRPQGRNGFGIPLGKRLGELAGRLFDALAVSLLGLVVRGGWPRALLGRAAGPCGWAGVARGEQAEGQGNGQPPGDEQANPGAHLVVSCLTSSRGVVVFPPLPWAGRGGRRSPVSSAG